MASISNLLARLLFMKVGTDGHRVIGIDRAAAGFDVLHDAVFVDDYVGALRPLIGLPLDIVVLEDSVVLEHFLVHVAEKWKFDVDLLGEGRVCRGGIHTDTEDCRIVFVDLTGSESSLDRLKLLRSTTGKGEDVHGEKDIFLAAKVRKLNGLPLIAEKGKVRSMIADFQRSLGDLFRILRTRRNDERHRQRG